MAIGESSVFFVECGRPTEANTYADVSAALVTSAVASFQTEDKTNAPKKQKTKRFHSQRDSLARRTQLLVGKEGSRRRQRWDNSNFSDHPSAVLFAEDLRPPGYGDRPTFHWVHDNEPVDELLEDVMSLQEEEQETVGEDDHTRLETMAPLSRKARQMLKKSRVPKGLVSLYEQRLLTFMERWREGKADVETHLIFEIGNPFKRWVIHLMCQYYRLSSFSKTVRDGRRLMYICHQAHLSYITKNGSQCALGIIEDLRNVPADWNVPQQLFSDYLFANI
ncbi:hypothetical protein EC973_004252 [Apophysomyces ossiformis]|uniref:R3H-associated N-terminal domain-containing protein n=1 Tax=Apophysomyces ossiformis TaxID=679940 RepID=A0A8H7ERH1_9FUNG|nr:hypothetical protein EC973_004252 [Apophysomyces ossiformis]